MDRTYQAVGLLRLLLVLLFVALVVGQVVAVPGQLATMAGESSQLAYLRWPLFAVSVLGLLCVQVVIVCTWNLLTMVKEDRIFTDESLIWVNAIVWALAIAWVLLAAVSVTFTVVLPNPGLPMLLLGMVLAGGVLVLLMVVMRALLRQATMLRTDMDAVI